MILVIGWGEDYSRPFVGSVGPVPILLDGHRERFGGSRSWVFLANDIVRCEPC